jgi:hypothetical protein
MPAAGWLNKSSCLASALGVTKFITVIPMILVTLYCAIKSDLDVQQTHLCILQYGMHASKSRMPYCSMACMHQNHACHTTIWHA